MFKGSRPERRKGRECGNWKREDIVVERGKLEDAKCSRLRKNELEKFISGF
jgi:hypothetical protein